MLTVFYIQPKASTSLSEKQKGKKAESSSSSSDSSDDAEETAKKAAPVAAVADDGNDSDSSSASSSSSSSSFLTTSSDEEDERIQQPRSGRQSAAAVANANGNDSVATPFSFDAPASGRPRAPSPTRPPSPPLIQFGLSADDAKYARALGKPILWGHLPSDSTSNLPVDPAIEREQQAAEADYARFREHYVSRLISRFGGSLDQIRTKEGNDLSESRLQVLIRSIADGSDAFSSKRGTGIWRATNGQAGERETVLEALDLVDQGTQDEQPEAMEE